VTKLFFLTGSAGLLLLVLGGAQGNAEALCVTVHTAPERSSYPVVTGDLLRVAFTHSIYGSHVEERFQVNAESFEPVDVRYSERRLVEFYGYESATRDGDWWVASPAKRQYQTLALRASQDSAIRISFHNRTFSFSDGAAHVSLGPCSRPIDG
jgi:hypothetical protein